MAKWAGVCVFLIHLGSQRGVAIDCTLLGGCFWDLVQWPKGQILLSWLVAGCFLSFQRYPFVALEAGFE
jgi:hypothetical protein